MLVSHVRIVAASIGKGNEAESTIVFLLGV